MKNPKTEVRNVHFGKGFAKIATLSIVLAATVVACDDPQLGAGNTLNGEPGDSVTYVIPLQPQGELNGRVDSLEAVADSSKVVSDVEAVE